MTRRLVLLTGDGPEHRYVANRLASELPLSRIVVDVASRPPSLRRAFRAGAGSGVSRVGLELFRRAVGDRAAAAEATRRVLGEELTGDFPAEAQVVRVHGVNSAEALTAVAVLRPHALLVYGTSILGDRMLGLARELAFNMHTGISPFYRGTQCAFWPVANGEPELIGATVHECTAATDGGQIFAVGAAGWDEADGLHELFGRAVVKGADLYVDTVRRYLDGSLEGAAQDLSVGREYRGYERTLGPELRARWALRRGLLERKNAAASSVSSPTNAFGNG
jgi:methionyl-tRNA formyltransferase